MNINFTQTDVLPRDGRTAAFATSARLTSLREERKEKKAQIPVDFLDGRASSGRPVPVGSPDSMTERTRGGQANQRKEEEAYFTALSKCHGGSEESVRVSLTLMESIRAEPDPAKQKLLLQKALRDLGQVVVAQIMAVALFHYGYANLAVEAQKYAAKSFARLLAQGFRWAFGIKN